MPELIDHSRCPRRVAWARADAHNILPCKLNSEAPAINTLPKAGHCQDDDGETKLRHAVLSAKALARAPEQPRAGASEPDSDPLSEEPDLVPGGWANNAGRAAALGERAQFPSVGSPSVAKGGALPVSRRLAIRRRIVFGRPERLSRPDTNPTRG